MEARQVQLERASELAEAVVTLLDFEPSLANELYRWRPTAGWVRRP